MTAQPDFSIDLDAPARFMRIALRGFWTEETMARYDVAVREAGRVMAAGGCPVSEIRCLVDARGMSTQAQDLIAEYRARFGTPDRQPKRIATVTSSALMRLQAQRVAFANQRFFEDEQEARDWLLG